MNREETKEFNALKSEINSRDAALEADKYAFQKKLMEGMGEEIKGYLKNPPKPSLGIKFKVLYGRWKAKRKNGELI